MATLGYEKQNERINMKTIVKKLVFLFKDIFNLMFKTKDSF